MQKAIALTAPNNGIRMNRFAKRNVQVAIVLNFGEAHGMNQRKINKTMPGRMDGMFGPR